MYLYLIETFCIVNETQKLENEFWDYDLIETFCIVNIRSGTGSAIKIYI